MGFETRIGIIPKWSGSYSKWRVKKMTKTYSAEYLLPWSRDCQSVFLRDKSSLVFNLKIDINVTFSPLCHYNILSCKQFRKIKSVLQMIMVKIRIRILIFCYTRGSHES